MNKGLLIGSLLYLSSCTTGLELKSVDYLDLFTDSNSKVWLVNKQLVENANFAPANTLEKNILIFHENGHCDYVSLKNLSKSKAKKGYFKLNSKQLRMTIDFKDEGIWDLEIPYLSADSILLQATSTSEIKTSVQLIPFPEL